MATTSSCALTIALKRVAGDRVSLPSHDKSAYRHVGVSRRERRLPVVEQSSSPYENEWPRLELQWANEAQRLDCSGRYPILSRARICRLP